MFRKVPTSRTATKISNAPGAAVPITRTTLGLMYQRGRGAAGEIQITEELDRTDSSWPSSDVLSRELRKSPVGSLTTKQTSLSSMNSSLDLIRKEVYQVMAVPSRYMRDSTFPRSLKDSILDDEVKFIISIYRSEVFQKLRSIISSPNSISNMPSRGSGKTELLSRFIPNKDS